MLSNVVLFPVKVLGVGKTSSLSHRILHVGNIGLLSQSIFCHILLHLHIYILLHFLLLGNTCTALYSDLTFIEILAYFTQYLSYMGNIAGCHIVFLVL
jgi:hypothetical protein